MTLRDLTDRLDRQGIAHALIGAVALAVYGVLRASDDVDVLTTDRRCLEDATWAGLAAEGVDVAIRRGDIEDPLAGVVRLSRTIPPIDVIVGRSPWQDAIIGRARPVPLMGSQIRVASPGDIALLKLYAGGPQDAWDIDQLLDAVPTIEPDVTRALPLLPKECAVLWRRILTDRTSR